MRHGLAAALAVLLADTLTPSPAWTQTLNLQEPPRFGARVDVLPLEVTVVDGDGRPVTDLPPEAFKVTIDGMARKVVNAEWIPLAAASDAPVEKKQNTVEDYSTNARSAGGRLIVLAIDQPNIAFGGSRLLLPTVSGFLSHLRPSDRVAAVGLGMGGASVSFTSDFSRVEQALNRMEGQRTVAATDHPMDLLTAAQIVQGDPEALQRIIDRDCTPVGSGPTRGFSQRAKACAIEVAADADQIQQTATHDADASIDALLHLIDGLGAIDGPKTVVLVSEGPVLFDGDNQTRSRLNEIGARAAAARTSLYALRLDQRLVDASVGIFGTRSIGEARLRMQSLMEMTGAARGAIFTVVGTGEGIFQHIERELSGYYLLGVEADQRDADGKARPLKVTVSKSGLTVRAWRVFVTPSVGAGARGPSIQATLGKALATPLPMPGLPLRTITFSLRGPESGKVQLLIHADIGDGYTSPQKLIVAYVILDSKGKVVDTRSFAGRFAPAVKGAASALPFTAGASLPPGDYVLRLAAADSDKVGSVEHPFHAALDEREGLVLSDLILGAPGPIGLPDTPTVGDVAHYGVVQGYLEAYGRRAGDVKVQYEVLSGEQEALLTTTDVPARHESDARAVFNSLIPTGLLPPGRYRLRANVSLDGAPLAQLLRAFVVAAPAAARSSNAPGADVPATSMELFLPVEGSDLEIPFVVADALKSGVIESFAARVPATMRQTFEDGISLLRAGDYERAGKAFKLAVQPEVDATPALAYLGVAYAAAGRDIDASGAWQAALVNGSDFLQLYDWLGAALLRAHQVPRAQAILEEARSRWPNDHRFTRPLALLYAVIGRGQDAVRLLERYMNEGSADPATAYIGLHWIYQIHVNGGVLHDPARDLALAHRYAGMYTDLNGPKQALVRQWTSYLERTER